MISLLFILSILVLLSFSYIVAEGKGVGVFSLFIILWFINLFIVIYRYV
jgi:hypothetical protein